MVPAVFFVVFGVVCMWYFWLTVACGSRAPASGIPGSDSGLRFEAGKRARNWAHAVFLPRAVRGGGPVFGAGKRAPFLPPNPAQISPQIAT